MTINDFWTAISAFAAILTLAGGAYALGRASGYRQAKLDLNNERESKRFSELYAPVMGFFTTCHITTSSSRGAPFFRQRLRNASSLFRKGQRLHALKAVFDRQDSSVSGEVEYGGSFPLSVITERLKGREQFADDTLIDLVAQANRSQYEEQPEGSELTAADLALFDHVCNEHQKLVRRFVGA